ncbi:hypothetical protein Rumeso_04713 [Rubellimicrobium mesophilum DSM 19309]|uniref:Uncharacterized protein n=1 Tax=Rubellimicrobium mesophilum DSM 19309 TaxID=442562 RepID=A0A017HGJ6_9RHOB|nr:hypothetical protein Rumeso_04713 [Rubellimicrobium mesophilum DSM 19309]
MADARRQRGGEVRGATAIGASSAALWTSLMNQGTFPVCSAARRPYPGVP